MPRSAARGVVWTQSDAQDEIEPDQLLQMLDAVGDVAIIVSRDRRIRFCNRAAEEFLGRKSPLRLRNRRIACTSGQAELDLGRAVDAACFEGGAHPSRIVLRRSDGVPVPLLIKCLDRWGDAVLLLAADHHPLGQRLIRPLKDYFGLTRSEALVAAAIAEGRPIASIAADRSVAIGTIRSQVKTIAAKLGCARQAEIGAIVRSIPYASL